MKSFVIKSILSTGSILTLVSVASADTINVVDIVPLGQSLESGRNAEPSIAVNPLNPLQMVAGAFSSTANGNDNNTLFWASNNGGSTWSSYGNLPTDDKTLAWRQDGVAPLAAGLHCISCTANSFVTSLNTYSGNGTNFGAPISPITGGLDQPWLRTGASGKTYMTYNDLTNYPAASASIRVSSNNGATYAQPILLDTAGKPAGGQDAPSVRSAVNGQTVYAAFTRWGTETDSANGDQHFANSQVVVVKSTNGGTSFSPGVTAATTNGLFANVSDTPLTFGHSRSSSDVAIAVDPNNASRVIVAYQNEVGQESGVVQLHVIESSDGGATWTNKLTTAPSVRAGFPGLSILNNGSVGLLYLTYDPATQMQSQHFLTTSNDFATTTDTLLGREQNITFFLGDFYDLTSVDNTFYGTFSAWNVDDGTQAYFPTISYQRSYTGTPGTADFALPVSGSVDPFFFSDTVTTAVPELSTWAMMLIGFTGLGYMAFRRKSIPAFA